MTALHGLQIVLAAVAGWFVVRRARTLLFRAPLDYAALERASPDLLTSGDDTLRRALLELEPAWVATLLLSGLGHASGPRREAALLEQRAELAHEGAKGQLAIVALGRIAVPLALLNVILEISWGLSGGTGLVALQKGLAARLALEHAMLAVCIGLGTAVVCVTAAGVLMRQSRRLEVDLSRAETWLETRPAPLDPGAAGAER